MKVSHSVQIALLFGLLLVALAAILVIKSGPCRISFCFD
jgi:hypothetical protein